MMRALKAFFADEDGATTIEIGLFGALISVVTITALGAMDDGIAPVFELSSNVVDTVLQPGDA